MNELDFDIDVVVPPTAAWPRLLALAAAALACAAFTLSLPPDEPWQQTAPTAKKEKQEKKEKKQAPAPSPAPPPAALAVADAFVAAPLVPARKPVLRRARALPAPVVQTRMVAGEFRAEMATSRARAAALIPGKQAVAVRAPVGERLAGVDRSSIDAVLRARSSAFRACYERALKTHADLKSTLALQFTIDAQGAVSAPTVRAQKKDPRTLPLSRCVRDVVKRARFASPAAPVSVSRTLTFRPDGT